MFTLRIAHKRFVNIKIDQHVADARPPLLSKPSCKVFISSYLHYDRFFLLRLENISREPYNLFFDQRLKYKGKLPLRPSGCKVT